MAYREMLVELARLTSKDQLQEPLARCIEAMQRLSGSEAAHARRSIAGEIGGFLRRTRAQARTVIAEWLIESLGIPATQTSSAVVMREVLGTATAHKARGEKFAQPGRTAATKVVRREGVMLALFPGGAPHPDVTRARKMLVWVEKQITEARALARSGI